MSVEKSLESKEEKVEVAKEEKNDNSNTNNSPMHDDEKNGMLDTFAASPVSHRRSITGKYDDFNYTQNEILLSRNGKRSTSLKLVTCIIIFGSVLFTLNLIHSCIRQNANTLLL